MSSSDPSDLTNTATNQIDDRGWTGFIRDWGLGGIFAAFVWAIIEGINSLGDSIMRPLQAFAEGIALLVRGTFGAPVRVIDAGATATVLSFTDGVAAFLGPAAFPVAMVSAVAGLWVFQRFWTRVSFSPIDFLRNR